MSVLVASLDDVVSQKAFAEAQDLELPVLSDPDGSVARKYGALTGMGMYASRVTFVIDPEGVVRHVDGEVRVKSHGTDLVAVVEGLQKAR